MVKVGEKYRHYKKYPDGDHTYEIIGFARHTENDDMLVLYKPLFVGEEVWLRGAEFAARPISMRDQEVEYNGVKMKRFTLIPE